MMKSFCCGTVFFCLILVRGEAREQKSSLLFFMNLFSRPEAGEIRVKGLFPSRKLSFDLSVQKKEEFSFSGFLRWNNLIIGNLIFRDLLKDLMGDFPRARTAFADRDFIRGGRNYTDPPPGLGLSFGTEHYRGGGFLSQKVGRLLLGGWGTLTFGNFRTGAGLIYSRITEPRPRIAPVWFSGAGAGEEGAGALHLASSLIWEQAGWILGWRGFFSHGVRRESGEAHSFFVNFKHSSFSFAGALSFGDPFYFGVPGRIAGEQYRGKLKMEGRFLSFLKGSLGFRHSFWPAKSENRSLENLKIVLFHSPLSFELFFRGEQGHKNGVLDSFDWRIKGKLLLEEKFFKIAGEFTGGKEDKVPYYHFLIENSFSVCTGTVKKKNLLPSLIGFRLKWIKREFGFWEWSLFSRFQTKNTRIDIQGGLQRGKITDLKTSFAEGIQISLRLSHRIE